MIKVEGIEKGQILCEVCLRRDATMSLTTQKNTYVVCTWCMMTGTKEELVLMAEKGRKL